MNQATRKIRTALGQTVAFVLVLSSCAWARVFVGWSSSQLPPPSALGLSDVVFSWKTGIAPWIASARKQGYRVYIQAPAEQAKAAAEEGKKSGCVGIIVNVPEPENEQLASSIADLRSAYPKLRFLVLNANGKQPVMRGSIIIKRDSVLEVSSPTAQPWIDANLALIRVEERARRPEIPLYSFTWVDQQQQRTLTAVDYLLAVAEAAAYHADLVLPIDEHLQESLATHDAAAWELWNEVRSMMRFSTGSAGLEPVANVAVVDDHLDISDEVLNLLARHNIPFKVFLPEDVKATNLKAFDILIVSAKPDQDMAEQIKNFATRGATVVLVDSHGSYPWQGGQRVQVNEQATSYAVGNGTVLELSEPVVDPETFAQDIGRLLGKKKAVLSLWNGLTTLAVSYQDRSGRVKMLELVNYAAEPVRVQVRVKGSFTSVRYETPDHGCCQSLTPVKHDGFTEFTIPDLTIAGRVHLESQ